MREEHDRQTTQRHPSASEGGGDTLHCQASVSGWDDTPFFCYQADQGPAPYRNFSLCLRRRFQFSFRSVLVFLLAVSLPLGWFAWERQRGRSQREAVERIGTINLLDGKTPTAINELKPGDIASVMKLKDSFTGDTLCDNKYPITFESMEFAEPVITVAIEPKTRADQDKMSTALSRLAEDLINPETFLRDIAQIGHGDPLAEDRAAAGIGHGVVAEDHLVHREGGPVEVAVETVSDENLLRRRGRSGNVFEVHRVVKFLSGKHDPRHLRSEVIPCPAAPRN